MAPTGTLSLGHSSSDTIVVGERVADVDVLQGDVDGRRFDGDGPVAAVQHLANADRRDQAAAQRKRKQNQRFRTHHTPLA